MSSETKSEPSSSRVRNNSSTKTSGKTFGAFEPPIPPIVADIRPWGAGKTLSDDMEASAGMCGPHLEVFSDGCQQMSNTHFSSFSSLVEPYSAGFTDVSFSYLVEVLRDRKTDFSTSDHRLCASHHSHVPSSLPLPCMQCVKKPK